MLRAVFLLLINLAFSLLLALSVLPVALFVAPILRETPAAGYILLIFTAALFAVMNAALWRMWRRRPDSSQTVSVRGRRE